MPVLAPAFAAVSAFAGTAIGQIVIGVAGSLALSLLQGMLTTTPTRKPSGVRLQVQVGDEVPFSFPVGYTATAGTRKYAMTWGTVGEVENAYLTEVRQLADLSIPSLNGLWWGSERVTVNWSATPNAQGYPVTAPAELVGKLRVKFRTGNETTADPFLVSQFGARTDGWAWQDTFIGRGAPHVILTALWDREVWKGGGTPEWLFEPSSIPLYDIRKDSTVGGSGSHRWANRATWEPSDNPIVIIYNIIRGIYYGDTWVYGGRNIKAFQLPAASWIAAMNECDVLVSVPGGGTEKAYRAGLEIEVNAEPLSVIEEILRTCNGRLSEIGGIFEVLVGAPGAAVYAFTDADILISRGQTYSSFPGLHDTRNAIEANYPEPAERWASKAAPSRYYPEFEAQDGGRRLATGLNFIAAPFGNQVQRVMDALVRDDRRWRTHSFCLPPDAWLLTGSSVVSWTSARNGYVNKKFLVVRADGEPGMMQPVVLREIDPEDFNPAAVTILPNPIGTLTPVRPAPQAPSGFQVFPHIQLDADGTPRRPDIRVTYNGNMPDIQEVQVAVRLKSTGAKVYDNFLPFEAPFDFPLNGVFLNATEYEVRIRYIPFSPRRTNWSAWLTVTTPDVKLVAGKDYDPYVASDIDVPQLNEDFAKWHNWVGENTRELLRQAQELATVASDDVLSNYADHQRLRVELASSYEQITAEYSLQIDIATAANAAIASRLEELIVQTNESLSSITDSLITRIDNTDGDIVALSQSLLDLKTQVDNDIATAINLLQTQINVVDGNVTAVANSVTALNTTVGKFSASGTFRTETVATEAGALTTIGLSAAASDGATTSTAALFLSAIAGGLSTVSVDADRFTIRTTGATASPFVFESGVLTMRATRVQTIEAGILRNSSNTTFLNLNTGAFRVSAT